jgi:hypothetical protein
MLENDLIYLTFRKVHTLEINLCEMQTPELSAGGWRMYLSIRRYCKMYDFYTFYQAIRPCSVFLLCEIYEKCNNIRKTKNSIISRILAS